MNSVWFSGCKTEVEREQMKQTLLSNTILLDKLQEICYNIGRELEEVSIDDYESPSWSHKMAHRNGSLEVIRKLHKILKVAPRES